MLPTTINILGTEFMVRLRPLEEGVAGLSEICDRTISVDETLPKEVQLETFYHELIHTMLGHLGLSALLKEGEEEAIAQGLGMALCYVVQANDLPRETDK